MIDRRAEEGAGGEQVALPTHRVVIRRGWSVLVAKEPAQPRVGIGGGTSGRLEIGAKAAIMGAAIGESQEIRSPLPFEAAPDRRLAGADESLALRRG